MSRVRASLNVTISGKTDQVSCACAKLITVICFAPNKNNNQKVAEEQAV